MSTPVNIDADIQNADWLKQKPTPKPKPKPKR